MSVKLCMSYYETAYCSAYCFFWISAIFII